MDGSVSGRFPIVFQSVFRALFPAMFNCPLRRRGKLKAPGTRLVPQGDGTAGKLSPALNFSGHLPKTIKNSAVSISSGWHRLN